jgi:hypothetical protein
MFEQHKNAFQKETNFKLTDYITTHFKLFIDFHHYYTLPTKPKTCNF